MPPRRYQTAHNPARQEPSSWQLPLGARCAWLLGPALVLGLTFLLEPGSDRQLVLRWLSIPLPETCNAYTLFALDCPGCGLTRGFVHLSRGDWTTAWQLNPMAPVLFVYLGLQIPLAAMRWFPRLCQHHWFDRWHVAQWSTVNQWAGVGIMLALILQWMVRLAWRAWL